MPGWPNACGPGWTSLTEECIVVSHGGVARVLMYLVCGLSSTEAPNAEIWQGRVIVFDKGQSRWV